MLIKSKYLAVALTLLAFSPTCAWGGSKNDAIAAATGGNTTTTVASALPEQSASGKLNKHLSSGVTRVEINAPPQVVWQVLTDFSKYPQVFEKIKSCRVTKREGNLVFTETYLHPHMFLNQPCQHVVNDLTCGPQLLTWQALDGNFKAMEGAWQLKPAGCADHCIAVYTLSVDAGGVIPSPIVGLVLRGVQKDVLTAVKKSAESSYDVMRLKTSKLPQAKVSRPDS